jgi:hypothetical protein
LHNICLNLWRVNFHFHLVFALDWFGGGKENETEEAFDCSFKRTFTRIEMNRETAEKVRSKFHILLPMSFE